MSDLKISLAAARVNAGLTQEDTSKAMGVSKNTIVNWEKGTTVPSVNQGIELSALYKMPTRNIFFEKKSN